ncbi:MAG: hypothetical protein QOK29_1743 [Rhodospirillaceae bacterium]|jgi:hypothetical protein|nr:hypothetical protein [Rhodospirillaceae bacterium]
MAVPGTETRQAMIELSQQAMAHGQKCCLEAFRGLSDRRDGVVDPKCKER